jgi:hypothetical protein
MLPEKLVNAPPLRNRRQISQLSLSLRYEVGLGVLQHVIRSAWAAVAIVARQKLPGSSGLEENPGVRHAD